MSDRKAMNEHILELAKQAGVSAQSETTLHPNQVKFAELIVLKCAEIADTAEPFLASDLIKEHFGIDQ